MNDLLTGFTERHVDVGDIAIHARTRGSGPPVLLLHGYPQTLTMWHLVAPALSAHHSVVLADLRGYGESAKPPGSGSHEEYSKRAMAADMVGLMERLGHDHFTVVGHDRGGRVAHRMALDHPDRVRALCILDIVPTLHMFDHVDRAMATSYFHWFFLTAGGQLPEQLIGADPEAWIRSRFDGRHSGGTPIHPAALEEYLRAFRDPRTVHATCEDYRAAAGIDLEHDRLDVEAHRRVTQPCLVLWGTQSYVGRNFEVISTWESFADSVRGRGIHADHYLAEEAPAETQAAILDFLEEVHR